jgi:hypothetical protein
MLAGVGAPDSAEQRGGAGAPRAWLLCGRPRAEVSGCAGRQVGGDGSLPLASLGTSGPQTPGRLVVMSALHREGRCLFSGRSLCFSMSSQVFVRSELDRVACAQEEFDADHS